MADDYKTVRRLRGMKVEAEKEKDFTTPFASQVPKDYKSPDVEDRRHEHDADVEPTFKSLAE